MKCDPINVRYEKCATCKSIERCKIHASLSQANKDKYLAFLLDQIARHPDKYQLEVVMAATKPTKNILVMDRAAIDRITAEYPDAFKLMSMDEIKGLSEDGKIALKDSVILEASKQYDVIYKIEIKGKPFEDTAVFSKVKKTTGRGK